MNNEMTNELLQKKAKIFLDRETPVHIVLTNNGKWLNGFIKEIGVDFLMIQEFKLGMMPVFFIEIHEIETYTKVEVKE